MTLRVVSLAEDELAESALWYEDQQVGLGVQFLDEYQNVIRRILAAPTLYGRVETTRSKRNLRRRSFKRFPYYVIYEQLGEEIVVLAVAHAKRRPNYWIRRR